MSGTYNITQLNNFRTNELIPNEGIESVGPSLESNKPCITISDNYPFVRSLRGKCELQVDHPDVVYPFELDNFQKYAAYCINKNEDILVTAHTGSGKTVIAECAIAHTLKQGKIAIFTSPIKTLSNEKYKDFKIRFNDEFTQKTGAHVSLGILTGDNKINPEGNCLIMTAEILRNTLYKLNIPDNLDKSKINEDSMNNFTDKIGCIIMDEVHYINDPDRGKVWEETIVLLKKDVQLVMLSGTIDKADEFANWVGKTRDKRVNLISTDKRIVPLKHYLYSSTNGVNTGKLHLIFDENNKYHSNTFIEAKNIIREAQKTREKKHKDPNNYNLIGELIEYLQEKKMLQALFFSFSRKNCEFYASFVKKNLVTFQERKEIEGIFNSYMHNKEHEFDKLPQYIKLKEYIFNGIAYHHSGLLPNLKEIIEIIFQKGLIKVLFATETFAVGVNMPTRTVIFTELEKYTQGGKRFLNTAEYKQMSGRAGRRGIDVNGYTIILPIYELIEEHQLKNILLGKLPSIQSKLKIDYNFFLKIIQSSATTIEEFIGRSLFYKEQMIVKNSVQQSYNDYEKQLEKAISMFMTNVISNETMSMFKELYSFDKTQSFDSVSSCKILPSKQQIKQHDKLKKEIYGNSILKNQYDQYVVKENINEQVNKIKNELDGIVSYFSDTCGNIVNYLRSINYLLNNDKKPYDVTFADVTQKGVIAAQINECNAIILTEMIINDFFDGLEPEEIVAVLAMFIDDAKTGDEMSVERIQCTDNVYNTLVKVNKLIEKMHSSEEQSGIVGNNDFWKITFDYVDIAYYWAAGSTIHETIGYNPDIYEGNFIRNMTKIYNMVNDVRCLCKLCGKDQLLPILEKIDPLIVRDIVTVNSLYLA
jgi:superfamily II RNA helicase